MSRGDKHGVVPAQAGTPRRSRAGKKTQLLPLRLDDTPLPPRIRLPDPIWIDMRNPSEPDPWKLLLDGGGK